MNWTRRTLFFAPLAIAGLMIAGVAGPVAAQDAASGSGGTIEVTGTGEAEAEAVGAVLQFILRAQFEGSDVPVPESKFGSVNQPEVTAEQVSAVVDALMGAGVPEENIDSVLQPSGPYAGMFGYGSAVVAADLDEQLLANVIDITDAAVTAGEETGVIFDPVNVAYLIDDCSSVERSALADAVADGQEQAETLAAVLGVKLGTLIKAVKQPTYGAYYSGGPASTACDLQPTLESALTTYLTPFDPSRAGEVEVYSQVLFVFEID